MTDLLASIQSGDLAAVEQAIADGINVNKKIGSVRPLEAALERPIQIQIAKLLISSGADASKVKQSLCAVIETGDPELVQALLDAGADPNMETPAGLALEWAIRANSPDIVRLLVQAGADVNACHLGESPLRIAITEGQVECALVLAEAGALPTDEDDPVLAMAVYKNLCDVVAAMLRHGANPNSRGTIEERRRPSKPLKAGIDVQGSLAEFAAAFLSQLNIEVVELYVNAPLLHIAAGEGHLASIRLLLKHGALPEAVDDQGETALQVAERKGMTEAIQLLRRVDADNATKVPAELALFLAVERGDRKAASQALAAGAAISGRDKRPASRELTPLMLAARAGHVDLVRWLLDLGADLAATDSTSTKKPPRRIAWLYREGGVEAVESAGFKLGRTALLYAAKANQAEVVRLLVAAGADVNAKDLVQETASTLAAAGGCLAAVQALVEAGVDVNQRGNGKDTPLINAVRSKDIELVTWLLHAGGDPNLKNSDGETAIEVARRVRLPEACVLKLEEASRQTLQKPKSKSRRQA